MKSGYVSGDTGLLWDLTAGDLCTLQRGVTAGNSGRKETDELEENRAGE